jgi:hypothetical protein
MVVQFTLIVAIFLMAVYRTARSVRVEEKLMSLIEDFSALKQAQADGFAQLSTEIDAAAKRVSDEIAATSGLDIAGVTSDFKAKIATAVAALQAIAPPPAPPAQ